MRLFELIKSDGTIINLQNADPWREVVSAKESPVWQGNCEVTIKVVSRVKLDELVTISDVLMVYGVPYILNDLPEYTFDGAKYTYEFLFDGAHQLLNNVQFYDTAIDLTYVAKSPIIYNSAAGFAQVIVNNLNRVYGPGKWVLGYCMETDGKTITFSGSSCLNALAEVCSAWNTYYTIDYLAGVFTLNIGKAFLPFPINFRVGALKGLYTLRRENVSRNNIRNIITVLGGKDNLPYDYAGIDGRLTLSSEYPRSEIRDELSIATIGPREGRLEYDEIFPTYTGTVSSIYEDLNSFSDSGIDFEITDRGAGVSVMFKTGNLAGIELEVSGYDPVTKTFTLSPTTDSSDITFPGTAPYVISAGDTYVMKGIVAQASHMAAAEAALLEEAQKDLPGIMNAQVTYKLTLEPSGLKREGSIPVLGQPLNVEDPETGDIKSIRLISFSRDLIKTEYDIEDIEIGDLTTNVIKNNTQASINKLNEAVNSFGIQPTAGNPFQNLQTLLNAIAERLGIVDWKTLKNSGHKFNPDTGKLKEEWMEFDATYTWIKYATSAAGAGMSDDPTGKTYIGLAHNKTTATESSDPADYTWSLFKGPQGDQGVPGPAGEDGQPTYTWIKYATSAAGAGMSDDPTGKTYIGLAHNKTSATESSDPADYTWSLFKGPQGDQGVPGPAGDDGQPTYTWIKYATSAAGAGMSDDPTGKTYIGLAHNKTSATESSDPGDYTWSLFKGPQGDQGVPGPAGEDGQPTYTWIKYATSAAGAGMSDDPTGKTYIGLAHNKTSATESSDPADYTWSLFKGPQGDQGAPGPAGNTGPIGKRITLGTVYYQSENETAPDTPSATAFDFSTKTFTALSEGWLIEAPVYEVGSSKKYWLAYFNVEESASGSNTGVPVFGVPKQALYLYVRELQTLPDANEAALFIGTKYAGNDPYSVIEMAAGDSKLEIKSNTTTSGYVSQAMSMRAKDTEGWNYTFGVTPEGLSFTKYKWTGGALSENRMILNKDGIEFWGTYQNDPSSFYRSDRIKLYNMFGFLDVTVGELYEDERGRIYRKHSSTRKETRTIHIGASITGTSLSAIPFTSSDVEWAIAGDLYINYQTNGLYMCAIGGAPSAQYWQYIGRPSYSASDVGAAAANHTHNQLTGVSEVTTLVSLPVTYRSISAVINTTAEGTISLASALAAGEELMLHIVASAAITVSFASNTNVTFMDTDTWNMASGDVLEVSIWCYKSEYYSVSSKIKE